MASKSFAAPSSGKRKANSGDKSNGDSRTKKPRIASTQKRRPFEESGVASDSTGDASSDDGEGGAELPSRPKNVKSAQGHAGSNNTAAKDPADKGLFSCYIFPQSL